MRSIRYLNSILTLLTVLVGMLLWTLWTMSPTALPVAEAAGIPDAGEQRMRMVSEIKALRKSTEEFRGLFVTGKAKVTVIQPGEGQPISDGNDVNGGK